MQNALGWLTSEKTVLLKFTIAWRVSLSMRCLDKIHQKQLNLVNVIRRIYGVWAIPVAFQDQLLGLRPISWVSVQCSGFCATQDVNNIRL